MDLVTGAMGSLVPKLAELLNKEYKLHKGVRKAVSSLSRELDSAHAALRKVAEVPPEQLNEQVRNWAREVREASYDMEDVLDTFLVRVEEGPEHTYPDGVKRLLEKIGSWSSIFRKVKIRHEIAKAIGDINKQLEEVAERRGRYRVDDIIAAPVITSIIDPRLSTLYEDATKLVGIDKARDELISMLSSSAQHGASNKKMMIVSIVGLAGLGKTTLAKTIYDNIQVDFDCWAFIPVGQNAHPEKVFRDMLIDLDKTRCTMNPNFLIFDIRQLIDELRLVLANKRYLIVIDDIWDIPTWKMISHAFDDNNLESRIIITTRNVEIAQHVSDHSYKLKPLIDESSKILFYGRIFGSEDKCPDQLSEVSQTILKKCGGVPLAITTISSLLVTKLKHITEWSEVCNSIGSGLANNPSMNNMRKILSLSYYDLPPNLKTCLLYLSIFPEDYKIRTNRLILRWIAEGFVQHEKIGDNLFELGESYFNDLINRSMIIPLDMDYNGRPAACRVHDVILDLICSLSREENFVTSLDDSGKTTCLGSKVRRLSLQKNTWAAMNVSQVRSVSIFTTDVNSMASLQCFKALRVLDLEGCNLMKNVHLDLKYVGSLFHLRYLGLRRAQVDKLPMEIGKLQFLSTLDLGDDWGQTSIKELPSTILRLTRLMFLFVENIMVKFPKGLNNLTSLEKLRTVRVDPYNVGIVEELGHLTLLRELDIKIVMGREGLDKKQGKALVDSLSNLHKMECLCINNFGSGADLMEKFWVPPSCLRKLAFSVIQMENNGRTFSTLPKWINPATLFLISYLRIAVQKVRQVDIQVLGTLPSLRYLLLEVTGLIWKRPAEEKFMVSTNAFPVVRVCKFLFFASVPSMFPAGSMPKVEHLDFSLRVWDFPSGDFDFNDLTMSHFPALQSVSVRLYRRLLKDSEEEVMEVENALRRSAAVHHNRPRIQIIRSFARIRENVSKTAVWL